MIGLSSRDAYFVGSASLNCKPEETLTVYELATLSGHTDISNCVSWSSDGRFALTGSFDDTVRIWHSTVPDRSTWETIATLIGHTSPLTSVSGCPDGSCVITSGTGDKTARIWQPSAMNLSTWRVNATLSGHTGGVTCARVSPDGKRAVTSSTDGTARIWQPSASYASNWQQVFILKGHTARVESVRWSPDGTRVITGSFDNTARIWQPSASQQQQKQQPVQDLPRKPLASDHSQWETIATLTGHTKRVLSVDWSPHGDRALTSSADKTARIWQPSARNSSAWETNATLIGHTGKVRTARWSPDGRRVLTASRDGTGRIWQPSPANPSRWEMVVTFGTWVTAASWCPDGTCVLTAHTDNTARVWQLSCNVRNSFSWINFHWVALAVIIGTMVSVCLYRWVLSSTKSVRKTSTTDSHKECSARSADVAQLSLKADTDICIEIPERHQVMEDVGAQQTVIDDETGAQEGASALVERRAQMHELSARDTFSSTSVVETFSMLTEDIFNKSKLYGIVKLGVYEHWIINPTDVSLAEATHLPIDRGTFGEVRRGWLYGGTEIAIKAAQCVNREQGLLSLANEMRLLRRIRHPNIVLFHGVLVDREQFSLSLVLEWVDGTNLERYVWGVRDESYFETEGINSLGMSPIFLKLLIDVARGMQYLHAQVPLILHRDLKPQNVLIETVVAPPRAKIADFGLSAMERREGHTQRVGTPVYMAPEVQRSERYSTSADVYSFGCVLLFTLTAKHPRPDIIQTVCKWMTHVENCGEYLGESIQIAWDCLESIPQSRPNFSEILGRLSSLNQGAHRIASASSSSGQDAHDVTEIR